MVLEGFRASTRRLAAGLVLAAATLPAAGAAHAGDGVQFSRDCLRTYVNKKVGDTEQWAITWDIYGNATGNVFKLDGSAPSLIECVLSSEDAENEVFACYGSDACTAPPCGGDQWGLIGTGVTIPLTFFFPPDVDPQNPLADCEPVE